MDRKDYAAAVQAYRTYLAKKPDDADAHFDLGNAYASLKQAADAKAEYEKAISLDPKTGRGLRQPGHHVDGHGFERRDSAFQKASELVPDRRVRNFSGLGVRAFRKTSTRDRTVRGGRKARFQKLRDSFCARTRSACLQPACRRRSRISRCACDQTPKTNRRTSAFRNPDGPKEI